MYLKSLKQSSQRNSTTIQKGTSQNLQGHQSADYSTKPQKSHSTSNKAETNTKENRTLYAENPPKKLQSPENQEGRTDRGAGREVSEVTSDKDRRTCDGRSDHKQKKKCRRFIRTSDKKTWRKKDSTDTERKTIGT